MPTRREGTKHLFLLMSLPIDDLEHGICHYNPQSQPRISADD
jgi:hypothetical protein